MKILRYKTVEYEEAKDAVTRVKNNLPLYNELAVNVIMTDEGQLAIVEPLDLEETNMTGEENENYIMMSD